MLRHVSAKIHGHRQGEIQFTHVQKRNVLGQTAAEKCEGFPIFWRLIPFRSSSFYQASSNTLKTRKVSVPECRRPLIFRRCRLPDNISVNSVALKVSRSIWRIRSLSPTGTPVTHTLTPTPRNSNTSCWRLLNGEGTLSQPKHTIH
jgi:hypothetical protein